MMKQLRFFLINSFAVSIVILSVNDLYAQNSVSSHANVELAWEQVINAVKYDLEIKSTKKTFNFSVKEAFWNGRLSPGNFKMRVRGRDKRNAPGQWSEYQDFTVYLDSSILLSPKSNENVISGSDDKQNLELKWSKVGFANKYRVNIFSNEVNFKKEIVTDKNTMKIDLPVGAKYQVNIQSLSDTLTSHPDKDLNYEFIVTGKALEKVNINPQESVYVRELSWDAPKYAQYYEYRIEKFDTSLKKYMLFQKVNQYASEKITFDPKWPGGQYRLIVKAQANNRIDSKVSAIKFTAKAGDRSLNAEALATLRQSIERLAGWYGFVSYMVTSVDYENYNYDLTNAKLSYHVVGGTTRLGLGHVKAKQSWGFLAAAELSHVAVQGFDKVNYSTLELNALYKFQSSDATLIRQTLGIVSKELPDVTASFDGSIRNSSNLKALGFRYGAELWYAITPKLGVQINTHVIPLVKKLKTRNDQDIMPTISYQSGFLASYRFSKNFTALFGYAYRAENIEYKTLKQSLLTPSAEKNAVRVKGHYLNLLLEYQL